MTLTLYHGMISTCSQKVRLALAEKGLSFEGYEVDVPGGEHLRDWYLAINPNGVIPTLVHDGVPIVDSSVICEYLEETFPVPALAPATAVERAVMRAWMRYFEEIPTAAIRVPSFQLALKRHFQSMSAKEYQARAERSPLRKHFYLALNRDGFSEQVFAESLEKLTQSLRRVNDALKDRRDFLLGQQYTIADIVLLPTLVRMDDLGLSALWDEMPAVDAWYARTRARPSFDIAYADGSRLTGDSDIMKEFSKNDEADPQATAFPDRATLPDTCG